MTYHTPELIELGNAGELVEVFLSSINAENTVPSRSYNSVAVYSDLVELGDAGESIEVFLASPNSEITTPSRTKNQVAVYTDINE